ncbi:MAG: proline--tRNA ligase [Bdellovibrionales bacterium]|nr:proline--tRNA ligase [Bdellovibrionales bacterium]
MKWSKTFQFTTKDAPSDAEIISHQLLMRAGFMKKVAPGIFTYSVFGLRAIRKLENIIREELARISCQEILMPMVQPRTLWDESGRWPHMGELLKFKNKNDHDFCLGATHEEVVSDYVRKDLRSYRDLPISLYQIQTKYRDEIRPRFGLMRGREFLMKDAYTFDETKEQALESYEKMRGAYHRIFERLGLEFRAVEADTGAIGGNLSHEFQVLAESGMDKLMTCESCNYASNEEITPIVTSASTNNESELPLEKFATPGMKKISTLSKGLNIPENELVKTFFVKFVHGGDVQFMAVLCPGDREVNLIKVKKVVGETVEPILATDEEVFQVSKAHPGSCGPVGLTIPVVLDSALTHRKNFIVGANQDGFHYKNTCIGRDFKAAFTGDVGLAVSGDTCPNCGNKLKSVRGSEVGHIFYLGKKYAEPMGVKFLDQAGNTQITEMGCYGIGVTRTVQAAIEQSHDKDGIIWPASIAPFVVHFCLLDKDEDILSTVDQLTQILDDNHIDYFIDDRDERPGVKFKDADLLGSPLRVTMGKKTQQAGSVEFAIRKTKEQKMIPIEQAGAFMVETCRNFFKPSSQTKKSL